MLDKTQIIDSLYKIMCTATTSQVDSRVENNDYFKRRVLGFRAEVEFEQLIRSYPDMNYLEGGQFISPPIDGTRESKNLFIYTTVTPDDPLKYLEVYRIIARWKEVKNLYFIQVKNERWSTRDFRVKTHNKADPTTSSILEPKYIFFSYNKTLNIFERCATQNFSAVLQNFNASTRSTSLFPLRKRDQFDYFLEYDVEILQKIYANRFFIDVVLRSAQGKRLIDLDGFVQKGKSITLVEVKEKSPITNDSDDKVKWRYGWDSRRILWYIYLFESTELNVLYNVRQITDRVSRQFVQWDSIFLDQFLKGVSWSNSRSGGGGEDTLLAPFLYFERLENVLSQL